MNRRFGELLAINDVDDWPRDEFGRPSLVYSQQEVMDFDYLLGVLRRRSEIAFFQGETEKNIDDLLEAWDAILDRIGQTVSIKPIKSVKGVLL